MPSTVIRSFDYDAGRNELTVTFVTGRVYVYSLIPPASRAEVHLLIGRILLAGTPPDQREAAVFDIVDQLDRGAALIVARPEREQLAELNLTAARRARASTAYHSALSYLVAGGALLTNDDWERRHELMFALELHRAECEMLTGALPDAEERLAALLAIFTAGLSGFALTLLPGFLLGYAAALSSWSVALSGVVPNGLVEIPAAIIAGGLVIHIGATAIHMEPNGGWTTRVLRALADYTRSLRWLIPALALAAFLEVRFG